MPQALDQVAWTGYDDRKNEQPMSKQEDLDWANRPETEEDAIQAGALRLLKVRHQFQKLTGRTHSLLPLTKSMPEKTESPTDDKRPENQHN